MLINNNNAKGLVRYCEIRYSLSLSMIWQKERWRRVKKVYHKVNNYQRLNQIVVNSEHERKLHGPINRNILKLL